MRVLAGECEGVRSRKEGAWGLGKVRPLSLPGVGQKHGLWEMLREKLGGGVWEVLAWG